MEFKFKAHKIPISQSPTHTETDTERVCHEVNK